MTALRGMHIASSSWLVIHKTTPEATEQQVVRQPALTVNIELGACTKRPENVRYMCKLSVKQLSKLPYVLKAEHQATSNTNVCEGAKQTKVKKHAKTLNRW